MDMALEIYEWHLKEEMWLASYFWIHANNKEAFG